jgi:hypothetical protein
MAYAKFVTRLNREGKPIKYGPYYYRSVRTPEGKVRNIYIGMTPETVVVQVPEQAAMQTAEKAPAQALEQAPQQSPELNETESVTKGTRRIRKFLARLVNS